MEHSREVSIVVSSTHRQSVVLELNEGPRTPSQIAEATDLEVTHVSRVLSDLSGKMDELEGKELIELLVPEDRRKGRLYGLTDRGKDVAETIVDAGL